MNIWHMQLHPDALHDWEHGDILSVLKLYNIVGMGRKWDNDQGQPEIFKNGMKFGDIIIIRHKDKKVIAVVEVISDAYEVSPEEEKRASWEPGTDWFELRRKIRIIDIDPDYLNEHNLNDFITFYSITLAKLNNPLTDDIVVKIKDKLISFYQEREKEIVKIFNK